MTPFELLERIGPDVHNRQLLDNATGLPDPVFAALSGPFVPSAPVVGVWPDPVAGGLALGPFGRLRALRALALGSPQGLEFCLYPFLKLVTFVPESHLEPVREALAEAGAGHIGEYAACTFSAPGIGTFLPGPAATPFIGQPGRLETVSEYRLETIVPEWRQQAVRAALIASHPYEEVAYDWFRLENPVTVPQVYEDQSEWWTVECRPDVVQAAVVHRPRVLHLEKIAWNDRLALKRAGIGVDILEPGELLLPGLQKLWEADLRPWQ